MPHATAKDLLREAVDRLPESASVEDAMERLLCLAKIERGRDDIAAGRLVEHEDVKRRFLQPQRQLLLRADRRMPLRAQIGGPLASSKHS